eukprot:Polyplicarium_translucidae@DN1899_c0_g1_i1.p3
MKNPPKRRRLMKELSDIQSQSGSQSDQVKAVMRGEDLTTWVGYLKGPIDTPYEGGVFQLDIRFPPEYPYAAPKIQFSTKIWHPNISSQTGAICLDVLKSEWSPALTIRTALLSIQALLSAPEPDNPQDAEVASMYKNDRKAFERTARVWTETFAQKKPESNEDQVQRLIDMGFPSGTAREALEVRDWNEEAALDALLKS